MQFIKEELDEQKKLTAEQIQALKNYRFLKYERQENFTTYFFDYHIYPTPLLGQDMTQGQFLSGVSQV